MKKISKIIENYKKTIENLYGMTANEFFGDLEMVKHERMCLWFINKVNENEETTVIIEFLDSFLSQVEA